MAGALRQLFEYFYREVLTKELSNNSGTYTYMYLQCNEPVELVIDSHLDFI